MGDRQRRWPRGTPWNEHGPGPGRFRGWAEAISDLIGRRRGGGGPDLPDPLHDPERQRQLRHRYGLAEDASSHDVGEAIRRASRERYTYDPMADQYQPPRRVAPLGSYEPHELEDGTPDPAYRQVWEDEVDAILRFKGFDPHTVKTEYGTDMDDEYNDWHDSPEAFADAMIEFQMDTRLDG